MFKRKPVNDHLTEVVRRITHYQAGAIQTGPDDLVERAAGGRCGWEMIEPDLRLSGSVRARLHTH